MAEVPLVRRTPIRARRATPRRRQAPRWTSEQWSEATQVLLARDHGRCPVCGHLLTDRAERHHRQRRRDGGDRYANLLLLHAACHAEAHAHPVRARDAGWIVAAYEPDPAAVPVRFSGTDPRWLLDDSGGRRRFLPRNVDLP